MDNKVKVKGLGEDGVTTVVRYVKAYNPSEKKEITKVCLKKSNRHNNYAPTFYNEVELQDSSR